MKLKHYTYDKERRNKNDISKRGTENRLVNKIWINFGNLQFTLPFIKKILVYLSHTTHCEHGMGQNHSATI